MKIDVDKFLFIYQEQEFGPLNDHKRGGLIDLLRFMNDDPELTDLRHVAYMLATVFHECAGTWLPIAEYGKGKGRSYGDPDPETGKTYYGRGYVQLTWPANYKSMSKIVGHDLYHDPDAAMLPHVAYEIMSYGMKNGSFTGVGLNKYINEKKCDYRNARRVINGTDCAELIAGYAEKLETILEATCA